MTRPGVLIAILGVQGDPLLKAGVSGRPQLLSLLIEDLMREALLPGGAHRS